MYIDLIKITLRLDWIELFGSKYSLGDIIICGFMDNDMPKFGKICDIIQIVEQLFFCVQHYLTKGTDHHYQSYVLELSTTHGLVNADKSNKLLTMSHPLRSHVIEASTETVHIVTKCILLNI